MSGHCDWWTPKVVFDAFAPIEFDLDPASPGRAETPWLPAREAYTEGGLERTCFGKVWLNPPFHPRGMIELWLKKFFERGNGIALVPDRTSAPWWHEFVPQADLVLFGKGKLYFVDGTGRHQGQSADGYCLLSRGMNLFLRRAAARGLGSLLVMSS